VQRLTSSKAELSQQLQRISQSAQSLSGRRGDVEREMAAAQEKEQVLEEQQKQLAAAGEELGAESRRCGEGGAGTDARG